LKRKVKKLEEENKLLKEQAIMVYGEVYKKILGMENVVFLIAYSFNEPFVEEKAVPFILESKWNTNRKIL
jgi:hypothetical protein